jgi:hypothetical protein
MDGAREAKMITMSAETEWGQEPPPEARLWQAVITTTIEDWISGTLRERQEAEKYLFDGNKDFQEVCQSAGMEITVLRTRLEKYRSKNASASTHQALAA